MIQKSKSLTPPAAGETCKTRDDVIAASRRLFTRYGHRKTSVVDIAREAGLCKATVYNHFPGGKGQIITEVARHEQHVLMEKMRRAVGAAAGPVEALRAFFETRVREIQRLYEAYHAERGDFILFMPLVVRLIDESREEESLMLRNILEAGAAEGVFRILKDSTLTAEVLFSAVLSMTLPPLGELKGPARRRQEALIDLVLSGLCTGRGRAQLPNKENP